MRKTDSVVQVLVSVPGTRVARQLSAALLERRLVACAQVLGPMTSHYRWKGRLESSREYLLLLKTRRAHLKRLEALVQQLHPYDVPELLVVPVTQGSEAYLEWLHEGTRPVRGSR